MVKAIIELPTGVEELRLNMTAMDAILAIDEDYPETIS